MMDISTLNESVREKTIESWIPIKEEPDKSLDCISDECDENNDEPTRNDPNISAIPAHCLVLQPVDERVYTCRTCSWSCRSQEELCDHDVQHILEACGVHLGNTSREVHLKVEADRNVEQLRKVKGSKKAKAAVPASEKAGKNYLCPHCEEKFTSFQSFVKHKKTHVVKKSFKCGICDKAFKWPSDLKRHEQSHRGEKEHLCTVCNRRYATSSGLNKHLVVHTDEKPYTCRVCGKAYPYSDSLKKHTMSHSGEKPYQCTICDRKCTSSSDLLTHIRIHTGEKPFKCGFCEKSFRCSSHLRVHERMHTNQKPHECSLCHKRFITSGQLQSHTWTHVPKPLSDL